METGAEFAANPLERIRSAAVTLLCRAEHGIQGNDRRVVNFYYEPSANEPHDDTDLYMAHILSANGLHVAVTQHREDLAVNTPAEAYSVSGFGFIVYENSFDSENVSGDSLPDSELQTIARILEHNNLQEIHSDILREEGLGRAIAISTACVASIELYAHRHTAYIEERNAAVFELRGTRLTKAAVDIKRILKR